MSELSYYEVRSLSTKLFTPPEAAARFIYLNRFCFNGLYRTNLRGEFNVPYAKQGATGSLPTKSHLLDCSKALNGATIGSYDFADLIGLVKAGDFVYLDPPFAIKKRRVFGEYGPGCFGLLDLKRLADALTYVDSIGASFVLSYADCSEARHLISQWQVKRVRTKRHIAGFAVNRRHAYELIVTNIRDKKESEI